MKSYNYSYISWNRAKIRENLKACPISKNKNSKNQIKNMLLVRQFSLALKNEYDFFKSSPDSPLIKRGIIGAIKNPPKRVFIHV